MSTQADVVTLAAAFDALRVQLQSAPTAQPPIDISPLQASYDALKPVVDAIVPPTA